MSLRGAKRRGNLVVIPVKHVLAKAGNGNLFCRRLDSRLRHAGMTNYVVYNFMVSWFPYKCC